jgi:hypothetical protein
MNIKFLSPSLRAPLDYGLVAGFALGPFLLGFSGIAATLSYTIAALVLVGALITAYPGGIVKLVPFPLHGYDASRHSPSMCCVRFARDCCVCEAERRPRHTHGGMTNIL